jgi:plasmid maintenance system antidote protein VapI
MPAPLTPGELERIAEALFGDAWKQALADVLEVQLHTVQNWARGRSRIPPGVADELAVICGDKSRELMDLAKALSHRR